MATLNVGQMITGGIFSKGLSGNHAWKREREEGKGFTNEGINFSTSRAGRTHKISGNEFVPKSWIVTKFEVTCGVVTAKKDVT